MEQKPPSKVIGSRSPGGPVTQYRLYFLDGTGGHFTYSHEFEADSDERAIRVAESWREGRAAELWAGARKIKTWDADR